MFANACPAPTVETFDAKLTRWCAQVSVPNSVIQNSRFYNEVDNVYQSLVYRLSNMVWQRTDVKKDTVRTEERSLGTFPEYDYALYPATWWDAVKNKFNTNQFLKEWFEPLNVNFQKVVVMTTYKDITEHNTTITQERFCPHMEVTSGNPEHTRFLAYGSDFRTPTEAALLRSIAEALLSNDGQMAANYGTGRLVYALAQYKNLQKEQAYA